VLQGRVSLLLLDHKVVGDWEKGLKRGVRARDSGSSRLMSVRGSVQLKKIFCSGLNGECRKISDGGAYSAYKFSERDECPKS